MCICKFAGPPAHKHARSPLFLLMCGFMFLFVVAGRWRDGGSRAERRSDKMCHTIVRAIFYVLYQYMLHCNYGFRRCFNILLFVVQLKFLKPNVYPTNNIHNSYTNKGTLKVPYTLAPLLTQLLPYRHISTNINIFFNKYQ